MVLVRGILVITFLSLVVAGKVVVVVGPIRGSGSRCLRQEVSGSSAS